MRKEVYWLYLIDHSSSLLYCNGTWLLWTPPFSTASYPTFLLSAISLLSAFPLKPCLLSTYSFFSFLPPSPLFYLLLSSDIPLINLFTVTISACFTPFILAFSSSHTPFPVSFQSQQWSPVTPTPPWLRRVTWRSWTAQPGENGPSSSAGKGVTPSSTPIATPDTPLPPVPMKRLMRCCQHSR